jgi:hypothetical protein
LKSFTTNVQFGDIANNHIVKDKRAVYYVGEPQRDDILVMTGADSETFTGISYHYDYPDGTSYEETLRNYYQDKHRIYRTAYPMPNVDKKTFQFIGKGYPYDNIRYSKDRSSVYVNANRVTGADVNTFRTV